MAALELWEGYRVGISAPRNKRSASKHTVLKNVIWNTPPTLTPRRACGTKMAENLLRGRHGHSLVACSRSTQGIRSARATHERCVRVSTCRVSENVGGIWICRSGGGGETQSLEGGRHPRTTAQAFLKRRKEFNLISYQLCTFPLGTAGGRNAFLWQLFLVPTNVPLSSTWRFQKGLDPHFKGMMWPRRKSKSWVMSPAADTSRGAKFLFLFGQFV